MIKDDNNLWLLQHWEEGNRWGSEGRNAGQRPGRGGYLGNCRRHSVASGSFTQPEETGSNHIDWTGLHRLPASSGLTGSGGPPGSVINKCWPCWSSLQVTADSWMVSVNWVPVCWGRYRLGQVKVLRGNLYHGDVFKTYRFVAWSWSWRMERGLETRRRKELTSGIGSRQKV